MVLYSNQYYYSRVQAGEETSLDQYVWQGLATAVLAALIVFSISTFSLVGNDGELGIATIQAKKKTHQLSNPLGQQIAILVGPDINPNRVRKQSAADSLIYGIMKPDDMVPAGVNEDYSYLVTSNHDKEISPPFKVDKKGATTKYANHGEKLHIETVPLSRLVEQLYQTKKQRQQVGGYTGALRTE